ncbi:hypothetical protein MXB_2955 [Myxobolus squamalis]|nr:hypothetical protein MXB_2955 [Myxobolus squamalis]
MASSYTSVCLGRHPDFSLCSGKLAS